MVEPRYRISPARDSSRGPEIVAFAAEHGMALDEWQQGVVDTFSGTMDDKWSSRSNVLIISRQNGKSEILAARALYGLFVLRKKLIIYSSHQWSSSNEIFLRCKAVIEQHDDLNELVKHVRLSAASLGFELHTGERLTFTTRSKAASRGFAADEIYIDEAHFTSEAAHAALRPTLAGRSAGGDVQTFYAASPVDQTRHPDGLVLTRLRQQGIAGEEGLALVEYSASIVDEEGHDLLPTAIPAAYATDGEILMKANPGCPNRISLEFLLDEARVLDPASFWTEHGGVGDWPDLDGAKASVIDLDKWHGLIDSSSKPVPPVCFGFDVSPDRKRASIAIGGRRLDGDLHLELVDAKEGVGWVVPRLTKLVEDHDPECVICDASQTLLIEQLWQVSRLVGVPRTCSSKFPTLVGR